MLAAVLVLSFTLPATAATMRIDPGPNGFGGPTVFEEFSHSDPQRSREGIRRRTVQKDSRGTNRLVVLEWEDWLVEREHNHKTVLHYAEDGRLLRREDLRTNEDVLVAGWDRRITHYTAAGVPDYADHFHIPEHSLREHVAVRREHYDPEGRIVAVIRWFTPDYTLHTGLVREIRRFGPEGLAELLTVASNPTLLSKGVTSLIESRAPILPAGGHLLWREVRYHPALAERTGIERTRRTYDRLGRPLQDEFHFGAAFASERGVVRGVLDYDPFGKPLRLTTYDRRQKVRIVLHGRAAIARWLGRDIPSLPGLPD